MSLLELDLESLFGETVLAFQPVSRLVVAILLRKWSRVTCSVRTGNRWVAKSTEQAWSEYLALPSPKKKKNAKAVSPNRTWTKLDPNCFVFLLCNM